jgi:hypothetical protein
MGFPAEGFSKIKEEHKQQIKMSAIPISQTTERTLAKSDYPVMEVDLMARRSGEKVPPHSDVYII